MPPGTCLQSLTPVAVTAQPGEEQPGVVRHPARGPRPLLLDLQSDCRATTLTPCVFILCPLWEMQVSRLMAIDDVGFSDEAIRQG